MKKTVNTEYSLGQVVKHKYLDFRGVIYDVDPEFNNTEEWYQSIPAAIRPKKDQLIFFWSDCCWNRLVPFFCIVKLWINIINYTSEIKVFMFNNLP